MCLSSAEILDDSGFIRADATFDSKIDISDPVTVLRTLFHFHGDAPIRCIDVADSNDDEKIDLSGAIYGFAYLFLGGARPPAPFPGSGPDPTADDLHFIEHF